MSQFASALEQGIRRQRRIPDATGWAGFVAAELGHRVWTRFRPTPAAAGVYGLWIRSRLGPASGATLPLQQGSSGSMEPVSPRAVLVSSLGERLPATVQDGVASSTARFDAIWSATPGTVPIGWTWSGEGRGPGCRASAFRLAVHPCGAQSIVGYSTSAGLVSMTGRPMSRPQASFGPGISGKSPAPHAADGAGFWLSSVLRDAVSLGFERGAWRGRLAFPFADGHATGVAVEGIVGTICIRTRESGVSA